MKNALCGDHHADIKRKNLASSLRHFYRCAFLTDYQLLAAAAVAALCGDQNADIKPKHFASSLRHFTRCAFLTALSTLCCCCF